MVTASTALAAGTIRTHVTGPNMGQTIKVGGGATPQQTQAIFTALQAHQVQRQNASPVRLQTTAGGSLVALAVHQTPPGSIVVSAQNTVTMVDQQSPTVSNALATHVVQQQQLQQQQQQQQQHQQQTQQQQQVRPVMKKRLQSFRFSKKP